MAQQNDPTNPAKQANPRQGQQQRNPQQTGQQRNEQGAQRVPRQPDSEPREKTETSTEEDEASERGRD